MIAKRLERPLLIPKLETLLKRIVPKHEKIPLIQSDLHKLAAGYRGEQSLHFAFSFLPENKYYILHDLRLFDGKHYFQIDVLILSTKYLLLLEVKNISGELHFDTAFNQLIRIKGEKKTAFPDPLTQVKRLKLQLQQFLKLDESIPIYSLIVIANPSSIITANRSQQSHILHSSYLPFQMEQISESISRHALDEHSIKALIKKIKKKHMPFHSSVLSKYQLESNHIQKGVICKNCGYLPINRINANWHCPKCDFKDKKAHLRALKDYYYLYGDTITNQQAKRFLQIDSTSLAIRLLKPVSAKSSLEGRGRTYFLSIKTLSKLEK
ncbi:nuclease-related domain-containing protein [Niallia sp. NCCP-28]|uniref:nuclease-related domain-containing protein n=1 Tax=Niallia sp. NCCP-28 TaxID=2934712 RepID=UPI002081842F|nr:nuclease-related domain-containing protein [Niallia sp. NCCP-28]GKU83548.1 nuclease [Niallia sp. NCCP-28]